jgi:hypothetical protein
MASELDLDILTDFRLQMFNALLCLNIQIAARILLPVGNGLGGGGGGEKKLSLRMAMHFEKVLNLKCTYTAFSCYYIPLLIFRLLRAFCK